MNNRTSGRKIIVYPMLPDLGMIRLDQLPGLLPTVAVAMVDGHWTKAAEVALMSATPGHFGLSLECWPWSAALIGGVHRHAEIVVS